MSDTAWQNLALLSFYWLAYFALHSLLASLRAKRWVDARFPALIPLYRLAFNGLSVLLLLPILWQLFQHPGPMLWHWNGIWAWLANGLALAALAGFVISLKSYDSGEFIGLRQWTSRTRHVEDQERFHLSWFHRHVRHPWYFFSLILIWTRDMDAAMLLSGVMLTLYLIVGSWLEERKLLVYHGTAYQRYMERVPGLFPLPGKSLSAEEAASLVQAARHATEIKIAQDCA